jgi:sodium/hydrogen exchanger-like protein 6/7
MASSSLDAEKIESKQEERTIDLHQIDSINLLIFTTLLVIVVLTIWICKRRNFRYLHETCLALVYGFIVGAILRNTSFSSTKFSSLKMNYSSLPKNSTPNWISFEDQNMSAVYLYTFQGPYQKSALMFEEQKAMFNSEIFFNIILPPIIFHAGYSMKRKNFFRNLGAILMFALLGTTIACISTGIMVYGSVHAFNSLNYFTFTDSLYFGAMISATDPVTVLAIFNDLNVDVDLYAIIFGESVLNDAVCLVLANSIEKYVGNAIATGGLVRFDRDLMFKSFGNFFLVFFGSFAIGSGMGCLTALMTKFTYIRDFPLLETTLFVLMSYSTFLASEAAGLSGIVAVLFCGIFQAHYTFNNLSNESKQRTRDLFELFNFLAENFIFIYIGITLFTFPNHNWSFKFIVISLMAIALARVLCVVFLSFLLNLFRKNPISWRWQTMIIFSGLRGAFAFALAIRNVSTQARSLMYTTTSIIVICTVVFNGTLTAPVLKWLKIRINVNEEIETSSSSNDRYRMIENNNTGKKSDSDKTWLLKRWSHFDRIFMKPLLTNSYPPLTATLPARLLPITKFLTTKEQRAANRNESSLVVNNDDSMLNNHPTLELIDIDGISSNTLDDYSTHKDETMNVNLRTDNNGNVSAHFTSPSSQFL